MKVQVGQVESVAVQPKRSAGAFNEAGQFIPDSRPMEPPIGFEPRESLFDQVRNMVHNEHMRRQLIEQGEETFEEANDFIIPGEEDSTPWSGYENDEDSPLEQYIAALQEAEKKQSAELAAAEAAKKEEVVKEPTPPKKGKTPPPPPEDVQE